jgi:hypothetical protein
MKREEKLLKYCSRRKMPFTIYMADLNDRAKLGYTSNGKRCSGLSKLLQRLAGAGKIDYEGVIGKGVMIRSVPLADEPVGNQEVDIEQVRIAVHELLVPVRNGICDIRKVLDDGAAVISKLDGTVANMFKRQLEMETAIVKMADYIAKITGHVEAISRHIGRVEVNEQA